jgi:TolB-like protein/class 3 adenylate cyclase
VSASPASSRVLTLVFTDLAGSTALKSERGDEAGAALIARHRSLLAALAQEHGGRIVDTAGDGTFLTFEAPSAGARFALALQAAHAAEPELPAARIGIHLGEVSEREGRVEGLAVDLAARVAGLALPRQVLLTAAAAGVRQRVPHELGGREVLWRSHGAFALKGASEPIEIQEVGAQGLAPLRPPSPGEKARPLGSRLSPRALALSVAALLAIAGGAWWTLGRGGATSPTTPVDAVAAEGASEGGAAAKAPIRSLAVLPLANLSGDPEQEYFADGMTETLIAELAKLPGVRIVSRTSVMQFKGAITPLRAISRELNVDGVIEDSVMRAEGRVRITAQLIDARSDEHLWAEQYDRELARVLEIQSEVARAVASEITLALTPEQKGRLAPPKPVDPRAQEAYFRGLAVRRWKAEALRQSIAEFEEAIRIAPDYAAPYAALANSRHFLAVAYGADPRHELPKARVDAKRAVALDPNLGDAHAALAGVLFRFDWDFAAAEQEFERGLSLGVSDPWSRVVYGSHLFATGRPAEAWRWLEAVAAAAPLDSVVRIHFAALLANGGEYERAIREANRVLASDSSDTFALVVRAICYERLERFDDALRDRRAIAEADGSMAEEARVLEAAWRTGGRVGYLGYYQRALDFPTAHFLAASSSAQAGARDLAIEQLERAYATRDTRMPFLVTLAALRPLHSDPRFADLARRMNLPPPKP